MIFLQISSILDVQLGSEYTFDSHLQVVFHLSLPPHLLTRPAPSTNYQYF